mmetsp:Transcript_77085/g.249469  ORF Transcript_77085/g.249469 Transcript_77085/m.249469 type:complete len:448 (-) Transcript_77085:614-1957(-)
MCRKASPRSWPGNLKASPELSPEQSSPSTRCIGRPSSRQHLSPLLQQLLRLTGYCGRGPRFQILARCILRLGLSLTVRSRCCTRTKARAARETLSGSDVSAWTALHMSCSESSTGVQRLDFPAAGAVETVAMHAAQVHVCCMCWIRQGVHRIYLGRQNKSMPLEGERHHCQLKASHRVLSHRCRMPLQSLNLAVCFHTSTRSSFLLCRQVLQPSWCGNHRTGLLHSPTRTQCRPLHSGSRAGVSMTQVHCRFSARLAACLRRARPGRGGLQASGAPAQHLHRPCHVRPRGPRMLEAVSLQQVKRPRRHHVHAHLSPPWLGMHAPLQTRAPQRWKAPWVTSGHPLHLALQTSRFYQANIPAVQIRHVLVRLQLTSVVLTAHYCPWRPWKSLQPVSCSRGPRSCKVTPSVDRRARYGSRTARKLAKVSPPQSTSRKRPQRRFIGAKPTR